MFNSSLLQNTTAALALIAAIAFHPHQADAATGHESKTISLASRSVPVRLDIYFPAEESGETVVFGKNAVFTGIELAADPRPKPGLHPVVIFSHGSGGNGMNTGWFAKALADQGMIVIAPNHPGSTSGDSDPEQSLKTWERPQDMSAIIDQLQAILPENLFADVNRIAAAGFSLGGYSALSLAGAQLKKAAFVDYCARDTNKGLNECAWFTHTGFDLNTIDKAGFERNNSDPRIKAVVSIDPGFAAAFTPESLGAIERPVKIINLGSEGAVPDGVNAEEFVKAIPRGEYARIEGAWHFDFLGECTTLGPLMLAVTFDDPICSEHSDRSRSDIHKEIAAEAVDFLGRQFAPTN